MTRQIDQIASMIGLISSEELAALLRYSGPNNAFRDFCAKSQIRFVPQAAWMVRPGACSRPSRRCARAWGATCCAPCKVEPCSPEEGASWRLVICLRSHTHKWASRLARVVIHFPRLGRWSWHVSI